MSTVAQVRNGIDVGQLMGTIDAIRQDPGMAQFTFKARSSWEGGTRSTGSIGSFTHAGTEDESRDGPFELVGDEPPVLLGTNAGPNAVELLLQSLAFCYAVGFVANAAARGIELERMEYEIEGEIDVRSFLGLEGPRAGFTSIRAKGIVSSPNASQDQLEDLCSYVQETSPVRDCLANAIPVHTTLEIV